MRLVVDASVVVGQLLRATGRARLADERLELFIPETTLAEVHVELPRRVRAFARRHALEAHVADELIRLALDAIETNVGVVDEAVYAAVEDEARWRCARDPTDWPLVASALLLQAGVWTADKDLLGAGVPTWTTETVDSWLTHTSEGP